jgi:hypothetical protein
MLMENSRNNITGRSPCGRTPPFVESYPELEIPYCLLLTVNGAMEISLRCPDMGVTHQLRDGSKVIPLVQEGCGKRMPHHMGVNPLLNQGLARHGFDRTIDRFGSKFPFFIESMLPQGIEYGMIGAGPISAGLQVILDGDEGLSLQRGIRRNFFPLPMTSMTA